MTNSSYLSTISLSERKRSLALSRIIKTMIQASPTKNIGFDLFMELALYAPQLGYYEADNEVFGMSGDFVTAPELGDLFGRCVARQCSEILTGAISDIHEVGAGKGTLAKTIIKELTKESDELERSYFIEDRSAKMRKLCLEIEENSNVKVVIKSPNLEYPINGVVIANELLDAMPAKRFIKHNNQIMESVVGLENNEFVWQMVETNPDSEHPKGMMICEDGHKAEQIQGLNSWLRSLFEKSDQVVVLIFDYGDTESEFLHDSRFEGALKCHYKQTVNFDPFQYLGLQDITTSVNFTRVARLAVGVGFELLGYTTLESFLTHNGIEFFYNEESKKSIENQYKAAQEAKTLLLASEMGHNIKVMALGKNFISNLSGFSVDLTYRL